MSSCHPWGVTSRQSQPSYRLHCGLNCDEVQQEWMPSAPSSHETTSVCCLAMGHQHCIPSCLQMSHRFLTAPKKRERKAKECIKLGKKEDDPLSRPLHCLLWTPRNFCRSLLTIHFQPHCAALHNSVRSWSPWVQTFRHGGQSSSCFGIIESPFSQGWPWTFDPPISASWVLDSETWGSNSLFYAAPEIRGTALGLPCSICNSCCIAMSPYLSSAHLLLWLSFPTLSASVSSSHILDDVSLDMIF